MGITSTLDRTGIVGASAAAPSQSPREAIWKIVDNGLQLALCLPDNGCTKALFLGGGANWHAGPTSPMIPTLLDPDNLGSMTHIVQSQAGVMLLGRRNLPTTKLPYVPWLGVWAMGPSMVVHHCQLEETGPLCRPATHDGADIAGGPVSVRTYQDGDRVVEAVWVAAGSILHCTHEGGASRGPTCRPAALGPGIEHLRVVDRVAGFLLEKDNEKSDVVWLLDAAGMFDSHRVIRCEATRRLTPSCALAKIQ